MKFQDGIHYLKTLTLPYFDSTMVVMWAIFTVIIILLAAFIFKNCTSVTNVERNGFLFVIFLSSFLMLLILNQFRKDFYDTNTAYQVMIDDNMSFNEINEKFTIINIDENIVTIIKKEKE